MIPIVWREGKPQDTVLESHPNGKLNRTKLLEVEIKLSVLVIGPWPTMNNTLPVILYAPPSMTSHDKDWGGDTATGTYHCFEQ
jgi:hypothetical protein